MHQADAEPDTSGYRRQFGTEQSMQWQQYCILAKHHKMCLQ